jgi:general secretion pathway protein F
MHFALKAIGQGGRVEALDVDAVDETGAVQQVEARGYAVLAVRRSAAIGAWRRAVRFPLILFSQELLVLLQAGIPLVHSIETLAQKERRPEWRTVMERLGAALREGRPLSVALEAMPSAFPALYVATVRASERTGDLAAALARYTAYALQIEAARKKLLQASIYPALLVGAGGLVSLFLMLHVVPRFSRIYEERASDLPLFSRLLLEWGRIVEGQALPVLCIAAVAISLAVFGLRAPRVRTALLDTLWRLPYAGERMQLHALARLYRTAGMLLRGGMPLVSALDMSGALLHPRLRDRLAAARQAIAEGKPVSVSLDRHRLATPVALRMLAVGERSGNMGEMMDRIAAFHDEEIERWLEWFTRLFEPLLMAAIGLVIGAIVVFMYMPIFELAGSLR